MLIGAGAGLIAHLVAVICGLIVGFSLAVTGAGGSTLGVPMLLYVVGVSDAHIAIGTSALVCSVSAYLNLVPHARAGHVRWRAGILFTVAGIVGAFALSEVGKVVNGKHLVGLFALLMIVVAALMLRGRKVPAPAHGGEGAVKHGNTRLIGTGLAAGSLAGFFGVGGGFLIVPGLMLAARMDIINAIGTSLVGTGSFALTTALNYARSGFIDWLLAGEFIAGAIAGGWVGAYAAGHLAKMRGALNILFAAALIVVAVYMLVRTLRPMI